MSILMKGKLRRKLVTLVCLLVALGMMVPVTASAADTNWSGCGEPYQKDEWHHWPSDWLPILPYVVHYACAMCDQGEACFFIGADGPGAWIQT